MNIVILGLSITSSWGNGHATTYRALVRELERRGHSVLFLERDRPWYSLHRDLPNPPFGETHLYDSITSLQEQFSEAIREADAVIVGSYVPEGTAIGAYVNEAARGITAFYDIDTPVTLTALENGTCSYLSADLIHQYDLYLSFTGGPTLRLLERYYGAPMARPLYCSVDPDLYYQEPRSTAWDLGYLGTYSDDRQPMLDTLLCQVAQVWTEGSFVVAGAQYPVDLSWPLNVQRIEHLPPSCHRHFYNEQRFTLNVTRTAMVTAGYSPSVRLFEAAACGTPIISDYWEGLDTFFQPGKEILIADSTYDALRYLKKMPDKERCWIGENARSRVMNEHTAAHRAAELEKYLIEALSHGKYDITCRTA